MNIAFQTWFEDAEEQDFNFWKDLILNHIGLDHEEGLSVAVKTLNVQNVGSQLMALGEFAKLQSDTQQRVISTLQQGRGTVGDLIRIIASPTMRVNQ
jgi:hypothetical protein